MVEKGTQLRTTWYVAVCHSRAKAVTAAQHPIAEPIGRMPLYANGVVTRRPHRMLPPVRGSEHLECPTTTVVKYSQVLGSFERKVNSHSVGQVADVGLNTENNSTSRTHLTKAARG